MTAISSEERGRREEYVENALASRGEDTKRNLKHANAGKVIGWGQLGAGLL
jgi:hypothetical protein